MGTFEKLGILVIVVIIVMILAVAIYQWGGTGESPLAVPGAGEGGETLIIPNVDPFDRSGRSEGATKDAPDADGDQWATGHPKEYEIHKGDNLWDLVQRWKLSESFVDAIRRANPGKDMKKLKPGDVIRIPNPRNYAKKTKAPGPKRTPSTRSYEVQEGDTLGEIASKHLGSAQRWQEITKLNPGVKPTNIRPGMKLLLPAK